MKRGNHDVIRACEGSQSDSLKNNLQLSKAAADCLTDCELDEANSPAASPNLFDDENGSTFSLLLIVIILAGVVIGGYFIYNWIQDNGGLTATATEAGGGLFGALWGAAAGFFGGAWQKGIDKGTKYNLGSWLRSGWDKLW